MSLVLLEAGHDHPTWEDFGPIEWITLVVAGIVAAVIVWKAVMYTIAPGETEDDHIKRQVLQDPQDQADPPVSSGDAPSPSEADEPSHREADER